MNFVSNILKFIIKEAHEIIATENYRNTGINQIMTLASLRAFLYIFRLSCVGWFQFSSAPYPFMVSCCLLHYIGLGVKPWS